MQPRAISKDFTSIKELLKEDSKKSSLTQLIKLLDVLMQNNEKLINQNELLKLYKKFKEIEDYTPAVFSLFGHDEYEEYFKKLMKIKNKFDAITDANKQLTLPLIIDYISYIDPPSATTKNDILVSDSESDDELPNLVSNFKAMKAETKLEDSKQQNGVDKGDEPLYDKMESIVDDTIKSFIPVQPDSKVNYGELSKEDRLTLASVARQRQSKAPRLPSQFDQDMEAAIQASLRLQSQSQTQQGVAPGFGYKANKDDLIKEKLQLPTDVPSQLFDEEMKRAIQASLRAHPLDDSNKPLSSEVKDGPVKIQSPVKSKFDNDFELARQASLESHEQEVKQKNFLTYTVQDILALFENIKLKTQELDSAKISSLDQIHNLSRPEVTKILARGNFDIQIRKIIILYDFHEAKKVINDFKINSVIQSLSKEKKAEVIQSQFNEIIEPYTQKLIETFDFNKLKADANFFFIMLNLYFLRDKNNILMVLANLLVNLPKTESLDLQAVIDGKNDWKPLNYFIMLNFAYRAFDYDDLQKVLSSCLCCLAEKGQLTQNQDKVLDELFNDPKTEFDFKWKGKTALRIAVERNNVTFLEKMLQINEGNKEAKRDKANRDYRYIALDSTDDNDKEALDFILLDPIKYIPSLKVIVKMQAQYDRLVEKNKGDFSTGDLPLKVLKAVLLQFQKQQNENNNPGFQLTSDIVKKALVELDENSLTAYNKAIATLCSPFVISKDSGSKYWTLNNIVKLMQELFPHVTKLKNNVRQPFPLSPVNGVGQQSNQRQDGLVQRNIIR